MPKRRIFIALPLKKEFSSALAEHLKSFLDLSIRFIPFQNWHLTLIFLGYLTDKEIREAEKIIEEASAKFPGFSLKSKNITLSPGIRPRMLWLNFQDNKIYNGLTTWLEERINFLKKENKEIKIHLTLARFDQREGGKIQEKFEKLGLDKVSKFGKELLIDKIQIMESRLKRDGAVYNLIREYKLKL